jgi:hypothetical protein
MKGRTKFSLPKRDQELGHLLKSVHGPLASPFCNLCPSKVKLLELGFDTWGFFPSRPMLKGSPCLEERHHVDLASDF